MDPTTTAFEVPRELLTDLTLLTDAQKEKIVQLLTLELYRSNTVVETKTEKSRRLYGEVSEGHKA